MRWLSLFALTAILAGALLTPTSLRAGRENTYVFHHENVLGTSLELKLNASTAGAAALAEAAVLREIARQSGILRRTPYG